MKYQDGVQGLVEIMVERYKYQISHCTRDIARAERDIARAERDIALLKEEIEILKQDKVEMEINMSQLVQSSRARMHENN